MPQNILTVHHLKSINKAMILTEAAFSDGTPLYIVNYIDPIGNRDPFNERRFWTKRELEAFVDVELGRDAVSESDSLTAAHALPTGGVR